MTQFQLIILILYSSLLMSRKYYYVCLFYVYSKSLRDVSIEIVSALISWGIMLLLFYHSSVYFLLLKSLHLLIVYLLNANLPNRQSESSINYIERVTIRSNSNPIESSQFECLVDLFLFLSFFGVKHLF